MNEYTELKRNAQGGIDCTLKNEKFPYGVPHTLYGEDLQRAENGEFGTIEG